MSNMGRGTSGDLTEFGKALRDTLDDIRALGLGAGRAGKSLSEFTGLTFAANAAALTAQRAIRDIAYGVGEDVLKHGLDVAGNSFQANLLRTAATWKMDPFQAGEMERPIEEMFSRLGAITGPIARSMKEPMDRASKREILGYLDREAFAAERDAKDNAALQLEYTDEVIQRRGGGAGSFMGVPASPAAYLLRKIFGVSMR